MERKSELFGKGERKGGSALSVKKTTQFSLKKECTTLFSIDATELLRKSY
jgi:hypothetical protein